jgi:flavin-dependent dehydrogenase
MVDTRRDDKTTLQTDVVVIGGGLAGLAAANHLVRGGLQVICLEPRVSFLNIVGESLDWSAPQLFAELGLTMEGLIEAGAATYKRHITVTAADGSQKEYLPGAWLTKRPWNVEVRTLHLDRQQIHALMLESTRSKGVEILHERATGFEIQDRRILSVETSGGRRIRTSWIVDASGAAASVLGREFNLSSSVYGPRKVALWAHFPTEVWVEGTTLYTLISDGEYMDQYMEWIWEIPIRPGVSSIGYIAPGSKVKLERAQGLTNVDLLSKQMQKFTRLSEILQQSPLEQVASTSFLCRTYKGVCGPNWIIIGEAASQSDPITGNGVTAALRHAAEGSDLICRYQNRGSIPTLARTAYNMRVSGMGRYFNSLIEKFYYLSPIRVRLGLFGTAEAYTIPAWLTNLVYSRTRPRRLLGTLIFCSAMFAIRGAAWCLFKICQLLDRQSSKSRQVVQRELGSGQRVNERREPGNALHTQR